MHLLAVSLKITIKFRLHIDYLYYELCLKFKKFTMYKRLLDISNNSHFLAIGRYHRTSLNLFGFGLSTDCPLYQKYGVGVTNVSQKLAIPGYGR